MEQAQTRADMNDAKDWSIMGRPTKFKEIEDPNEQWDLFNMDNPPPPQGELSFKQPKIIKINPAKLRREEVAEPVANNVLRRQFMADRAMTRGQLNSKQLTALDLLQKRSKKAKRVPVTLSFAPAETAVEAVKTAKTQANLFNTQFTSPLRSA